MYYKTLNSELQLKYGCKVYKLSLDGGCSCPNRDGTAGTDGCIFCGEDGSGEFSAPVCGSISAQLENAKKRVAAKNQGGKYIAYFQSFSNTYAPIEHLRKIFYDAISPEYIVALSIATRPDCLSAEVIDLLCEINSIKPVWIELGLQTIHADTAKYIRRGYALSVFDNAMQTLKTAGIYVVAHQILFLPGETCEQMIETTKYISKSGCNGIKFHMLYVLEGTDLKKDYLSGKITLPDMAEYISVLAQCIMHLSPNVTIHRLTGDGAKSKLVAPKWTANKKSVLNTINKRFTENNIRQGILWKQD